MKKRISIILAAAMLLALAVPFVSFAAVAESDVEAVLISKDGTEIDRGDLI